MNLIVKISLLLLQIIAVQILNAQDTLVCKSGAHIPVKIIKIGEKNIRYKPYNNLKGDFYIIEKSKILSIIFKDGTTQTFNAPNPKEEYLKELTKKGNKVFIEADDQAIISHANYELRDWGYWQVVKDREEADFILRFNFTFGIITTDGFVEYINPIDDKVLKKTDNPHGFVLDLNAKRGTIKKLIEQLIMPDYK